MFRLTAVLLALALAGCATLDKAVGKPDLVPGKSTQKEVIDGYGKPAMELKRPNGDTWLYFTQYPWGRDVQVAVMGANGVLKGMENRLTHENIHSIKAGMSEKEVHELLGPPRQITPQERQNLIVWEYPWLEAGKEKRIMWVHFSPDKKVVKVVEMHDEVAEPTSA